MSKVEEAILQTLRSIEARLQLLERRSHGATAVYMGDGRVLLRTDLMSPSYTGPRLIYLLEGDDKLLAPRFIADGVFESEVTSFFMKTVKPTDNCLDVGTNFGYYTCLFGRLAPHGKTIAVEADPKTYAQLLDNIRINWIASHVRAVNLAAADQSGHLTLHRRLTRAGNTSIIKIPDKDLEIYGEPPSQTFEIPSRPLDSLLDDFGGRIDVMKVDVEGAEPLVFAGATQVVRTNPALDIIMEWAPRQIQAAGFDVGDFGRQLVAMKLHFWNILGGQPVALQWTELETIPYLPGVLLTRKEPAES